MSSARARARSQTHESAATAGSFRRARFQRSREHAPPERSSRLLFSRPAAVLHWMPDACILTNEEGVILHANDRAAVLFDAAPEEIRGVPLSRFVVAERRQCFRAYCSAAVRAGLGVFPLVFTTRGGRQEMLEATVAALHTTGVGPRQLWWALRRPVQSGWAPQLAQGEALPGRQPGTDQGGESASLLLQQLRRANVELTVSYDATIEGWSRALELRDQETEGHTRRVTDLTVRLARAAGLPDSQIAHIRRGAQLHDIGKMGIPDRILLKPGPLDPEEKAIMRQHPIMAYEMLSAISFLRPALEIPLFHHERWDGTGYPHGLAGEEIPFSARLFAIADVWDALRSRRPYRDAWTEERAFEHICSRSGSHFDPRVVELFTNTRAAFDPLFDDLSDMRTTV